MKLKEKVKSYSFWVSIASAIILILKVLGGRFGFTIDESMVSDIFTAICSILVLMGIIVLPAPQNSGKQTTLKEKSETKLENNQSAKETTISNQNNESNTCILNSIIEEEIETDTQENKENIGSFKEESIINENIVENQLEIHNNIEETETGNQIDSNDSQLELADENFCKEENTCNNQFIDNQNKIGDESLESSASPIQEDINQNTKISLFEKQREQFASDLNEYIFYLQEEIKNIREKM